MYKKSTGLSKLPFLTIFGTGIKTLQISMMCYTLASPSMFSKLLLWISALLIIHQPAGAQKVPERAEYIAKYSQLAVDEMRRSGIPASITMAQAILESSIGRSDLATKANNHFGIKCHVGWSGDRFYYDDDEKDECFRVYANAEESFKDHSIFLLTRDRYKGLFDLDINDYKAWSHGLKEAGYATNPVYAHLLIKIIEEEELYLLDNWIPPAVSRNRTDDDVFFHHEEPVHVPTAYPMPLYNRNRIDFVVAEPGETVESLTEKLNMLSWEIRKYNELDDNEEIRAGSIVYLQPKRRQAARGFDFYVAKEGETVYSISQHFGVKMKWILKRNNMEEGDEPTEGQKIWLRGNKPDDE